MYIYTQLHQLRHSGWLQKLGFKYSRQRKAEAAELAHYHVFLGIGL
jgi:hypothetical protein